MRRLVLLLVVLAVVSGVSLAGPNAGGMLVVHDANLLLSATDSNPSLGPGSGELVDSSARDSCGTIVIHTDGTYENAYASGYEMVAPPDYGAFAECYSDETEVCAVVLDLTTAVIPSFYFDIYVWDDDNGIPGTVLASRSHLTADPIAYWPTVTRHYMDLLQPVCTGNRWWVGFWGDWPSPDFWVGADLNGPGGCPYTNIAPGQEWPSGWQPVSVIFGPTQALGIGAEVRPCPPVPANSISWGRVKSLYHDGPRQ